MYPVANSDNSQLQPHSRNVLLWLSACYRRSDPTVYATMLSYTNISNKYNNKRNTCIYQFSGFFDDNLIEMIYEGCENDLYRRWILMYIYTYVYLNLPFLLSA